MPFSLGAAQVKTLQGTICPVSKAQPRSEQARLYLY